MRLILDWQALTISIAVVLWVGFGLGWLAGRRGRRK